MDREEVVTARTRQWLERIVIGLNLCPFAKAPYAKQQLRFVVSAGRDTRALLAELVQELEHLQAAAPSEIETTLLIHPQLLTDFDDYNDFLDEADGALHRLGLDGIVQIASFHPQYCFADAEPDDIANATNRSPYPMLHLLREASVERAVAAYPDPDVIVERNVEVLRELGAEGLARLQDQGPTQ